MMVENEEGVGNEAIIKEEFRAGEKGFVTTVSIYGNRVCMS
jgi:hypothetical protein